MKIEDNSNNSNNIINNLKLLKNKNYNFVYSKNYNNTNNSENIHFIQDKKKISENDTNIENKVVLTEINKDLIIEPKKTELNNSKHELTKPKEREEKKESYSKNNFYNMRAKKNKNILPKVNRSQKTIIIKKNIPSIKIESSKLFENHNIKSIDTTIKIKTK